MVMPAVDLTGRVFGYLTVLHRAPIATAKTKTARWVCQCACGNVVERQSQYLRNTTRKYPRSCGCHHGNEMHKMSYSRPFRIWMGLRSRCTKPTDKDWKNYGARGITVCPQWLHSFETFWRDMQPGYADSLTLDRLDVNGPYSPDNCRWATTYQQANNTRYNRHIDTPKGRMTIAQAARAFGLKPVTLYARLTRYKWPLERALSTPGRTVSTT
jgi:hypothetical protein